MRNRVVSFVLALGFILVLAGLVNLQILEGPRFRELSKKNCIRLLTQEGSRGRILDRRNTVIIGNRLSYDVLVLPQDETDLQKTLQGLAGVLSLTPEQLDQAYRRGYLSPSIPVVVAKNVGVNKAIALSEMRLDLPDVVVQPHPVRDYPFGNLASHVVGYLNEIDRWRLTKLADYGYKTKDIVGFGGIEEKCDYYLRQEEGALSEEVDHRGRFMRVMGFKPPTNGRDVQLTLDVRLQKIAEDKLSGRKGSVILMNPGTGEILAMASSPAFSPAAFVKKSDAYLTGIFASPEAPLVNRAISGVYPAGSVFKTIVASAGLETGRITLGTTFVCNGSMYLGSNEFSCSGVHGAQDVFGAIAHSCNIFFYKAGLAAGAQAIHDYALRFGFSRPSGIDLPYESSGFVPSPLWRRISQFKNWYDGDTVNLSIGQGDLLVTPIQITRMMAVFANGGYLVTPYIVKGIHGEDISVYQTRRSRVGLKNATIDTIRQGLRLVVSDSGGTARILSALPLAISGKTGTVQVPRGAPHGWFTGYFPSEKPRFVICVFLEHGGSGVNASGVARNIIQMMVNEQLL
jgi:penicillin-binding protein 2